MRAFPLIVITFFFAATAVSQTQIFNIPSADIVGDKGQKYFETYYTVHAAKYENDGYNELSPRITYAVTDKLEVGLNFRATSSLDDVEMEFQPNVKYRYMGGEKKRYALAVGAIAYFPITRPERKFPSALFYTNGSKTLTSFNKKDVTLTGGIYTIVGGGSDVGTRNGVMAGVEHDIFGKEEKAKLTFTADWMSGKNDVGYSSAGFVLDVKKNHCITAGYIFGNSGARNNGFVFAYGYYF